MGRLERRMECIDHSSNYRILYVLLARICARVCIPAECCCASITKVVGISNIISDSKEKMKNIRKSISSLTKGDLLDIRLIIFDVDGVIVPRGTKIKQKGNNTHFNIKVITPEITELIKNLKEHGFLINISSGRSLTTLMDMFRPILPYISLTFELGSATWDNGIVHQHINSFNELKDLHFRIREEIFDCEDFKGIEPKEHIITVHCKNRIPKLENLVSQYPNLTSIWNGEAYDIVIKGIQSKGMGVKAISDLFKINKENILAIGDNYNDKELLESAGISITCDRSRVNGDFFISKTSKGLPAKVLISKILEVLKSL